MLIASLSISVFGLFGVGDLLRVEDLPSRFAAHDNEVRVVVILSPSSPSSQFIARAIERDVAPEVFGLPVRFLIVWTPVLSSDSRGVATGSSTTFSSLRTEHFWDATRRTPRQYGQLVRLPANRELGWNCVYIHGPKRKWSTGPPAPDRWFHRFAKDNNEFSQAEIVKAIRAASKG